MKKKLLFGGLIILLTAAVIYLIYNSSNTIKEGSALQQSAFNQLVWSDEFEKDGPVDTTNWFHQTQLPKGGSWFNNELQHYTSRDSNSTVKNGNLLIIAKKETFTDQNVTKEYTSARLNAKFAFTYGRVEIRAKLPQGVGTWPAIWMLSKHINEDGGYWDTQGFGSENWPTCGEIDIMEHWGKNQDYVQSALHTSASHGDELTSVGGQEVPGISEDFHVYALEWTEDYMVFSVDQKVHYVYEPLFKTRLNWPYDSDQYLLLNIAIEPIIDSSFEQDTLMIDYVRVYQ